MHVLPVDVLPPHQVEMRTKDLDNGLSGYHLTGGIGGWMLSDPNSKQVVCGARLYESSTRLKLLVRVDCVMPRKILLGWKVLKGKQQG